MDFIIFIVIIACGFFFGRRVEKKHYASILEREEKYKEIIILSDRNLKEMGNTTQGEGVLLTEGTVVSIDSFKKMMAGFVNFFGGRIKSYESLVDRARREAVLKLKQSAADAGYNCIGNLRIETSSISKNAQNTVGSVEAMAYGSGLILSQVGK